MANSKVIALIDSDSMIQDHCNKIEECQQRLVQQMEFLKKQAKDLHEKFDKEVQPVWESFETYLESKGLLKTYDKEKQHISFSLSNNAVCIEDANHEISPMEIIKRILT